MKASIAQRDFSLMELRPDFQDADDLEARARSLKGALNMRPMATRTVKARPGTKWKNYAAGATALLEIRPADGLRFMVMVLPSSIRVYDETGTQVFSTSAARWTEPTGVWIAPFRGDTIFGHPVSGLQILDYNKGNWTLRDFNFADGVGGELAQPYFVFARGSTITPSARQGDIVITASQQIFSEAYIGTRIRYIGREILVTGFNGPANITGTVLTKLAPSFAVTVSSSDEFRVGEVVTAADTSWQGRIVSINENTLRCITLTFFDGPLVNEKISGPTATSTVTAKGTIDPLPSTVWDEPLMSNARGWPRSGVGASNRLVLCDFPEAPDTIAISSARSIRDFGTGAADDDAIVRREGNDAPRFLHAINAGDLLLLSDRGAYYVPLRDSGAMTPSNFNAVLFDKRGASPLRPAAVEGGILYVESNGVSIASAQLSGNVNLQWSVRDITLYHHHLINAPIGLCGPATDSKEAEKYIFVVNGSGTLAALSWNQSIEDEGVGFAPWTTAGKFFAVAPAFGRYWCLVDRTFSGNAFKRMLEVFDYDALTDSQVDVPNGINSQVSNVVGNITKSAVDHLRGNAITFVTRGVWQGDAVVNEGSTVTFEPDYTADTKAGLNFICRVQPWPVDVIENPRAGTYPARVIRFRVSMLECGLLTVTTNNDTREFGGFAFNEEIADFPLPRNKAFSALVFGSRRQPLLEIAKMKPSHFHIGGIVQEVQG